MKTIEQLINNLAGQLQGINKMLDKRKDCSLVITQMKAVKSGLNAVMNRYLEENFNECFDKKLKTKDKRKISQIVSEIIKNN